MKVFYIFLMLFIFYVDKASHTMCHNPHPQSQIQLQTGGSSDKSLESMEAEPLEGEIVERVSQCFYMVYSHITSIMLM
jgi:hypothetical protein